MKNVQTVLAISVGILIVIASLTTNIITLKHCAILEEKLQHEETYRYLNEVEIELLKEDISKLNNAIGKVCVLILRHKREEISLLKQGLEKLSKNMDTDLEKISLLNKELEKQLKNINTNI